MSRFCSARTSSPVEPRVRVVYLPSVEGACVTEGEAVSCAIGAFEANSLVCSEAVATPVCVRPSAAWNRLTAASVSL